MSFRLGFPRITLLLLLLVFISAQVGCLGYGGTASVLTLDFPEQAPRILDEGRAFDMAGDAFVLALGDGAPLGVLLPRRAGDALRFQLPGEGEVRVYERGVTGDRAPEGRALRHAREDGAAYWTATEGGYEEWLYVEPGALGGEGLVAVWEVEGATLREEGDAVELADETGAIRLRATAPRAHAASGHPIEARLVAKGSTLELHVDGADGSALLVDPLWTLVSPMATPRGYHVAALLGNGKVLVAGGLNGAWPPDVEIFDPITAAWALAAPMASGRSAGSATVLPNGKVLVVGGYAGGGMYPGPEIYDPVANTWSPAGVMALNRAAHTATLLPSGKVLVAGGFRVFSGVQSTIEIYDPATNTWSSGASMSIAHYGHTATLLLSGKVLVAGGSDDELPIAVAELYDPVSNTWAAAPPLAEARASHTATLLPNGRVLIAGGGYVICGGLVASAEIYDPVSNTWANAASMSSIHCRHTATLLPSGIVLAAGGYDSTNALAGVELYDPALDTWTVAEALNQAREAHTATLLPAGGVLVAGGMFDGTMQSALSSAERYVAGSLGSGCAQGADCGSGHCADGVCCDAPCDAGPCDACSVAAGAAVDGTCAPLTGPVCDDGSACTKMDVCANGVCVGGSPVMCLAMDECHEAGACDPLGGLCSNPAKGDGAPCSGGVCAGGSCVAAPDGGAATGTGGGGTGGAGMGGGGVAGAGGGESPASTGGCGCGVSSSPAGGALGLGLMLAFLARRRRRMSASE